MKEPETDEEWREAVMEGLKSPNQYRIWAGLPTPVESAPAPELEGLASLVTDRDHLEYAIGSLRAAITSLETAQDQVDPFWTAHLRSQARVYMGQAHLALNLPASK